MKFKGKTLREWLFGDDPKPSETWIIPTKDPFRYSTRVEVLDVQSGYVQYRFVFERDSFPERVRPYVPLYSDPSSMKRSIFKSVYKKEKTCQHQWRN